MVTTEVIASLLATAWAQAVTPVNIMAGFKKCGVYPLNPGEVTNRQIAPSKTNYSMNQKECTQSEGISTSPDTQSSTSPNVESIFIKRYEEGYDIYDKEYVAWLRCHNPESIPPNITSLTTTGIPFSGAVDSSDSLPCTASSKYYV